MGYVKLVKSGNLLELYEYDRAPSLARLSRPRKKGRSAGHRRSLARRKDNVGRLRKAFARLVRSNLTGADCPSLFTFTMSEVLRVDQSYRIFTRFVSRLRRLYGKDFRYIGVPEFQKRGAVHFHVLFWGLPDSLIHHEVPYYWRLQSSPKLLKRYEDWCSLKSLDPAASRGDRRVQVLWSMGYVDCVPTDGSPRIATYLAKYMSKALQDDRLLAQKAYFSSHNVMRPMSSGLRTLFDSVGVLWAVDKTLLQSRDFETQWLGRCRYRSYLLDS